jgi:hypothetical protein
MLLTEMFFNKAATLLQIFNLQQKLFLQVTQKYSMMVAVWNYNNVYYSFSCHRYLLSNLIFAS